MNCSLTGHIVRWGSTGVGWCKVASIAVEIMTRAGNVDRSSRIALLFRGKSVREKPLCRQYLVGVSFELPVQAFSISQRKGIHLNSAKTGKV